MIKRRFARTNKRRYTSQLAAAEIRERFMRHMEQHLATHVRRLQLRTRRTQPRKRAHRDRNEEGEESLDTTTRYVIANTSREGENVLEWVLANRTDIATKV